MKATVFNLRVESAQLFSDCFGKLTLYRIAPLYRIVLLCRIAQCQNCFAVQIRPKGERP